MIDADGLSSAPASSTCTPTPTSQLLANPAHEAKVHQGVTLEVLGQDGLSYAPVTDEVLEQLRGQLAGWNEDPPGFDWSWRTVGEYLDRLDATGIAVNAAYLVPHGTIRMCAMGYDDRAADRRRARAHEAAARRGARAGRRRPVDRTDLHARDVRRRRRDRRAARGRARARRLLHAAPPQLRPATRSRPTPTASRSRAAQACRCTSRTRTSATRSTRAGRPSCSR